MFVVFRKGVLVCFKCASLTKKKKNSILDCISSPYPYSKSAEAIILSLPPRLVLLLSTVQKFIGTADELHELEINIPL